MIKDNSFIDLKKRVWNLERQMSKIAKYIIEKQIEEDEKYLKDKIKGYCPQCGNTDVKVGSKYYAFGLINTWTLNCPKCGEWEIQEIEKN